MRENKCRNMSMLMLALVIGIFSFSGVHAQPQSAGGGYYIAGYGGVYGSFGQASAAQSRMYDQLRFQNRKTSERDGLIKKWGLAAVEKAERERASGASKASNPAIVVPPPPVVRNYGMFRPDKTVDTGKALSDALGETPAEKASIKQNYLAIKPAYEAEAVRRGWKNNIAGALTFFTATAMTIYHDGGEPDDAALERHFKTLNLVLDEIPEFGKVTDKEKQGFNDMLIGFSGLLLAGYSQGKQQNDAAEIASYRKLAGALIQMVLKTDPNNLRLENGMIVVK